MRPVRLKRDAKKKKRRNAIKKVNISLFISHKLSAPENLSLSSREAFEVRRFISLRILMNIDHLNTMLSVATTSDHVYIITDL